MPCPFVVSLTEAVLLASSVSARSTLSFRTGLKERGERALVLSSVEFAKNSIIWVGWSRRNARRKSRNLRLCQNYGRLRFYLDRTHLHKNIRACLLAAQIRAPFLAAYMGPQKTSGLQLSKICARKFSHVPSKQYTSFYSIGKLVSYSYFSILIAYFQATLKKKS